MLLNEVPMSLPPAPITIGSRLRILIGVPFFYVPTSRYVPGLATFRLIHLKHNILIIQPKIVSFVIIIAIYHRGNLSVDQIELARDIN